MQGIDLEEVALSIKFSKSRRLRPRGIFSIKFLVGDTFDQTFRSLFRGDTFDLIFQGMKLLANISSFI